MILRAPVALLAALAATRAAASDAPPSASFTPGLLQATLGLALVLALIWAAAWLLRRVAPSGSSGRSLIKVIASQAVGQRERVVLLEIADQWLLVGVAPGQVTVLQTLAKSVLPEASPAPGPGLPQFSRLLAQALGRRER